MADSRSPEKIGKADIQPTQLEVINKKNGSPFVCGLPCGDKIDLSISYSCDTVLVGCSDTCRIGVDVENRLDPDSALPSLVLSEQERELLNSGFWGFDRSSMLLLLWCLKEAILKTVGLGFSLGYLTIEFFTDSSGSQLYLKDHNGVFAYGDKISCLYDLNEDMCAVICRIGKETFYD